MISTENHNPTERDLRIWHIPQIPMEPFYIAVPDVSTAVYVVQILVRYDLFQFLRHIKPDYSNMYGLEVFENGSWVDWYGYGNEDFEAYVDRNRIKGGY